MASRPLRGYRRLPGSAHHYLSPNGVEITEYEYRSRKARAAGWRNYTQQRHFRESDSFGRYRFSARSADRSIDTGYGSEFERMAHAVTDRQWGDDPDDDHYDELREFLSEIGAPDWLFWRFWYSGTGGE